MSDYSLKPRSTLIVGMTGSGKTTFALEYLKKSPCVCRFVFDDQGQASNRLKIPLVFHPPEMERALSSRWVLYNPDQMYPGDMVAGFRFFCEWAFKASKRGQGHKILLVDEIWRFQDRDKIPKELAVVSQMGRVENLELVSLTQLPHLINSSITGSSTEMVCFRLDESVDLLKVGKLGAPPEVVQNLPMGSFVSVNRLAPRDRHGKRKIVDGKVF